MNWKALKEAVRKIFLLFVLPLIAGIILATIGLRLDLVIGWGRGSSALVGVSIVLIFVLLFWYRDLSQRNKE